MNQWDYVNILIGEHKDKPGQIQRIENGKYRVEIVGVDEFILFGDGMLQQIECEDYWSAYAAHWRLPEWEIDDLCGDGNEV